MTASAERSTPTIEMTVHFRLIKRRVTANADALLRKLTGPQLRELVGCGELEDTSSLGRLLSGYPDEGVAEAYLEHRKEYRWLNRALHQQRGYGLGGDEELRLTVPTTELLTWLEANNPRVLNLAVLDYIGPDLRFEQQGRRWSWSTRAEPHYSLVKQLGNRKSARALPSASQALTDAVAVLELLPLIRADIQTAVGQAPH